jgi:hypothetical protein
MLYQGSEITEDETPKELNIFRLNHHILEEQKNARLKNAESLENEGKFLIDISNDGDIRETKDEPKVRDRDMQIMERFIK